MLRMVTHTRFKRDWKRSVKRGKDVDALYETMLRLARQERLEPKYRDHQLKGQYSDRRLCHQEPDWLLMYRIEGDRIIFERTGTHSDLFKL